MIDGGLKVKPLNIKRNKHKDWFVNESFRNLMMAMLI